MTEIRRVRPEDAEKLTKLAHEIWRDHYPPIIGQEQTEYLLAHFHSEQTIRRELTEDSVRYIVTVEDGEFAGYVGYRFLEDGGIFISKVYVHKKYRKKGYARAMLRHILKENPDTAFLRLYVNKKNVHSQEAYQRLGFTKRGEFKEEIGGGFFYDDYIMQMDHPSF